ncbi:MAG: AAA family ATPase [Desulfobacteraceae bacterium]|nr:AAA family ATPase [Desulfobacteraceae bacterium]
MKFPYGICDFKRIIMQGYFYCDRTHLIPVLERGEYQLFLRPRRFGKSLLLSMLRNYYDIAGKDEFQTLFGNLNIGKNPTLLCNNYFILEWDFSCVDPSGTSEDIKRALHNHVNSRIDDFISCYENLLERKIKTNPYDAISSIQSLITAVRKTSYPVYLLIDEYDNFANEVMMGVRRDRQEMYEALVYEEGPLKTLFKAVKSSTKESVFDRIFITGVSPVVMSDITSGYNIGENIYFEPDLNELCGFTEPEIEKSVRHIVTGCDLNDQDADNATELMRTYYNGYLFSLDADTPVYNPTMAIYFMKAFQQSCKYPRNMLDANLAADEAKLRYISQIPGGSHLLLNMMKQDYHLIIPDLENRFGIQKMLSDQSKNNTFMASFLYYFGVLTTEGETDTGEISLKVPNLAIRGLYTERIREMLIPEPADRDEGIKAAGRLYSKGEMKPLCDFVEQKYFSVFRNRDYRWANELTVKTAFLTLLYNDILYIMDSEQETGRRYTDLTMIIRPDMRRFKIFDILIEFKYVRLKQAGLTGDKARKLTREELESIPVMRSEMEQAENQVRDYGDALKQKYGNLRLRSYAVVSLGFERILWEEI